MNKDNIQWTIDLLKAVPPENFDINVWFNGKLEAQHKALRIKYDDTDFTFSETVAPDGSQPFHQCGNTACVWGWMSLEPHFRNWVKANTHRFELDTETDQAAAFWGVAYEAAAFIITGDYDEDDNPYDAGQRIRQTVALPESWEEWKPDDVIRILQAALDGEKAFNQGE